MEVNQHTVNRIKDRLRSEMIDLLEEFQKAKVEQPELAMHNMVAEISSEVQRGEY